jgi:hypothetical protein
MTTAIHFTGQVIAIYVALHLAAMLVDVAIRS